jgi:hypothetical protein
MTPDPTSSVRAQLLKIQALAEAGSDGERDNAKRLLDALCRKHNISRESLVSAERDYVEFKFSDKYEEALFLQCLVFICRTNKVRNIWKRTRAKLLLTKAEAIDLEDCWKHYRGLWKSHVSEVRSAFIHKHRLFGPATDAPDDDKPVDMERLMRIINMMKSMAGDTWQKPMARLT